MARAIAGYFCLEKVICCFYAIGKVKVPLSLVYFPLCLNINPFTTDWTIQLRLMLMIVNFICFAYESPYSNEYASWTLKGNSHSASQTTLLSPGGICSQAGGCSAERTAPGWFHPFHINVQNQVFKHLCSRSLRQVSVTHVMTLMQVFAHGNFHSRYPCLRFVYLRLFQVLWLATFLRVTRGADLGTVNPKGKEA
jgi:hypothetical protein